MENHIARKASSIVQQRIDALKIGQKMQDLPEHLWHESFKYYVKEDPNRAGGPNMRMIRLDPEKPSLTVTGYIFNKFVHPFENRFVTVREAARLQGFPDDFVFKGVLTSTQQQVGNAVPVQLAKAVSESVLRFLTLKTKKRVFSALSLFSGAGGFDIGTMNSKYQTSKFETLCAIDSWKDACDSLQNYYADLRVIHDDITKIRNPKQLWKDVREGFEDLDYLFGGPPCQAFSQAGKQKGVSDIRGQMVFEFVRFVKQLKPKVFVLENVSNLKGIEGGRLFEALITELQDAGYNIDSSVLTASDFGAPQNRKRIFILGTRNDLGQAMLPKKNDYKGPVLTVGDAFKDLPCLTTIKKSNIRARDQHVC